MRNHGEVSDPDLKIVGYNYRMCEVEACIVYHQFKYLDDNIKWRQYLCEEMTRRLKGGGIIPPKVREGCKHSYYTYAMKIDPQIRDTLQDMMLSEGVYFGKGYVKPLYLLPLFGYERGLCPVCEKVEKEIMVTDIFRYPMENVDKVMETLERCLTKIERSSRKSKQLV
jgi:dTDP-4-amino-4,6-dideoxygalactose transaminase